MSGKVVKLTGTFTIAKRLSDKKLAENDTVGALNVWLNLEDKLPTHLVYSAIANLYFRLENYENSIEYWCKYLSVAEKKNYAHAYYQIAICYVKLENLESAGYYFSKHITFSNDKKSIGLNDDVFSIFEDLLGKNNGFTIVSPPEKVDYRETIYMSRVDMRMGDFESAIDRLKVIPYGSKYYEEGCARLVEAYSAIKKYAEAEKVLLEALKKNPNSILLHISLCQVYLSRNKKVELIKCYNECLSLPEESADDIDGKGICAVFLKDDINVVKYYEKFFQKVEFNHTSMFFLGIAYLNLGRYKDARNCFNKLYMSDHAFLYSCYTSIADKLLIKNGEGNAPKTKFHYDTRLPQKEFGILAKKTYDNFIAINRDNKLIKEVASFLADNSEYVMWVFTDGPQQIEIMLIALLGYAVEDKEVEKIVKKLLVKGGIEAGVKRALLEKFIYNGYEGAFGFMVENVFRIIEIVKPPIDGDDKELVNTYLEAYYLAVRELLLTPEEDFTKLSESITNLFYNENNKFTEKDVRIIAGATIVLAKYRLISKASIIAKRLGVKSTEITKFIKSMEKKDD